MNNQAYSSLKYLRALESKMPFLLGGVIQRRARRPSPFSADNSAEKIHTEPRKALNASRAPGARGGRDWQWHQQVTNVCQ